MQQNNGHATWNDVFAWINTNKTIILFGSLAGLAMLLIITTIGFWVFGMVVQPFTLGMTMTIYYATLSTFAGDRRELFIKEAMCYYVATVVILVLNIGFTLPQA